MARQHPNLMRRGNIFYIRMRVPTDVVDAYGREFFVRSLRTSEQREAVRRLRIAQGEAEKAFQEARARCPKDRLGRLVSSGDLNKLSRTDKERLSLDWFRAGEGALRGRASVALSAEDRAAAIEENELEFRELTDPQEEDEDPVWHSVRQALVAAGAPILEPRGPIRPVIRGAWPLNVDAQLPNLRELESLFRRGSVILNRLERAQLDGTGNVPTDPLFAVSGRTTPARASLTLDELISGFERDPGRPAMAEKTRLDYGMVFRLMREVIGADFPVRDISRHEHCHAIRELLLRLPANATKKFPSSSLSHAADEGERRKLPGLNAQTINSHLNKMSTVFNWAVKEGHMPRNSAVGLAIAPREGDTDEGRRSFTTLELFAIFNAPLYTGCCDDERGFATLGSQRPRRSRFWVPLIALFAGMRQNEICQMLPTDIQLIGDTPIIRVQKSQVWQRLKSKHAKRVIPIHPELLRIGLFEYARTRQSEGATLLFPELRPDVRGYMAGNFQKRFATFLTSVGIHDPAVTFHSFRHTWRDALRRASVPEERVQALGGWTGAGEDKNYGRWSTDPELVAALRSDVNKVRYESLSLSHLHGS